MSNAITALYREEKTLHSCHCWLTYFRCAQVKEKHTYNFNTIDNVSSPHSSRYRRRDLSCAAMQGDSNNKPSQQQPGLQPDTISNRVPTNAVQERGTRTTFWIFSSVQVTNQQLTEEVCSWPSHKLGCHPLPGQATAVRLPLKSPCLPACECSLSLLPTRTPGLLMIITILWRPDSPSCHSKEESHCTPRRREARHPAERSPRGARSQPWEPALAQGQPGEEAKVWGKNRWRGSRVRSGRKTVEELQRD